MDKKEVSELTVILPSYNEEKAIGKVIDEIRSLPVKCDILVVDNNSTDDTYNIALYKEAKVVTAELQGKGNAMKKGFKLVNSPYVVMMNSDYTYPVGYIPLFYQLLSKEYDVVVGYRYWKQSNSMSLANFLGNKILSQLASVLYRKRIKDVCTGLWGFRKEVLNKFEIQSEGFTLEAELFTEVVRHECNLVQIPISYRARQDGSKAKLRIWDGFKIGWFLIKKRWKH